MCKPIEGLVWVRKQEKTPPYSKSDSQVMSGLFCRSGRPVGLERSFPDRHIDKLLARIVLITSLAFDILSNQPEDDNGLFVHLINVLDCADAGTEIDEIERDLVAVLRPHRLMGGISPRGNLLYLRTSEEIKAVGLPNTQKRLIQDAEKNLEADFSRTNLLLYFKFYGVDLGSFTHEQLRTAKHNLLSAFDDIAQVELIAIKNGSLFAEGFGRSATILPLTS
ncbi:hypothetical protein A2291_03465 [candidate division WOR-1 bacterium RIFOXYB2_FULL_42_35]|uniref:Uncharacterized protein n=1 Tax=candidate division WOR-1 bacterium RIFOXYC2_FULL_41_25 TaxID=1802586 RepID=A0A1F4TQE5_UNCSA|nr:MAG: hypothetical protein A2247_03035 [candidate division WOR-1 bacterium RIFOXYA2_FULL_41_14]OGC25522.1 MAG: hypothetical protein A2291_03465 [candidate division WOR-1 bacterium RIFOXYB2_FULL_42_35]OGC34954.1 MAG: hypothetical protein A2462_05095 [candidate division WOR-1 bacterium RIFOXYC2_FULL_41_25]OGC41533.1 MAG: hypothetical protein A2548_01490 [candidate division WOR-1 bacterium RIFOXYD2_FULL_41_8]